MGTARSRAVQTGRSECGGGGPLRKAYQTPETVSLGYVRNLMFTHSEELGKSSKTCFEISGGYTGEQLSSETLDYWYDAQYQLLAGRCEVKGLRALILGISTSDNKACCAELVEKPHKARPLDIEQSCQLALPDAICLRDVHERRCQRTRESECGELLIVAASQFLAKWTERRDERAFKLSSLWVRRDYACHVC